MKCPACEYELWSLKAGPCPECGRPFKPSDFDFLANAVRFCCPHCDQAYYGTSATGQLEPSEFDCVSCGTHITVDEMVLRPAEALGQREPTRAVNPWLDPHRKRRWFAAVGAGLGQPGRMLEATPAIGTSGSAWGYVALNLFIAGALGLTLSTLLLVTGGGAGVMMFMAIATLLVPAVYLVIWTVITHGLLKLFGQDSQDGIGRTFQALAFTSGAWLFALIPCMGWFFGFIAWSSCAPAAVRGAHRCKLWAAVLATLATPALTAAGVTGFYVWLMVSTMNTAQIAVANYGWAGGTQLDWEVIELSNELRSAVNAGTPPLHGASLLGQNSPVPFSAFSDVNTIDTTIGRPPTSHLASQLDSMSEPSRAAALAAITSTWPADVTAHRVGRIIFTHHGITPSNDPRLWLLIELPIRPGDDIADAVHLSGASMFNVRSGAQLAIDQQNRLRAAENLPPLPSYQTLTTTDGPWTAADGAAPASASPGVP